VRLRRAAAKGDHMDRSSRSNPSGLGPGSINIHAWREMCIGASARRQEPIWQRTRIFHARKPHGSSIVTQANRRRHKRVIDRASPRRPARPRLQKRRANTFRFSGIGPILLTTCAGPGPASVRSAWRHSELRRHTDGSPRRFLAAATHPTGWRSGDPTGRSWVSLSRVLS